MVSFVSVLGGLQRIPNTQVVDKYVGVAAGDVTRDAYTCPTGKKAIFNPLNWTYQIAGTDSITLQILKQNGTVVILDTAVAGGNVIAHAVQSVLLAEGDKLQLFMHSFAAACTAYIGSSPLELPA